MAKSLHRKMLTTFVPLIVAALVLVATTSIVVLVYQLDQRFTDRLKSTLRGVHAEIIESRRTLLTRSVALAGSPEVAKACEAGDREILLHTLRQVQDIGLDSATVLSPDTTVLVSASRPGQEGEKHTMNAEIRKAMAGRASCGLSAHETGIEVQSVVPLERGEHAVGFLHFGRILGHAFLSQIESKFGVEGSIYSELDLRATTFHTESMLVAPALRELIAETEKTRGRLLRELDLEAGSFFFSTYPLARDKGCLVLALPTSAKHAAVRTLCLWIGGLTLLVIGITLLVLWLSTLRIVRPLRALTQRTKEVAQGDLDRRLEIHSGDEIGELAESFESMTAELRETTTSVARLNAEIAERVRAEQENRLLQTKLTQSQKMEALGMLAGGVAHDFNNLLAVMGGYCESLLDGGSYPTEQRVLIEGIQGAAQRAADLTRQLLTFSRHQQVLPRAVDPRQAFAGLQQMLDRLLGDDVQMRTQVQEDIWPLLVDPGQFEQVMTNLAVNAREAMLEGGELLIEARNCRLPEASGSTTTAGPTGDEVPEGDYVAISVTDTGIGMTEDTLAHIFEPFFSTKHERNGTGLGLATSYGIVRRSGGRIDVKSTPGTGTTFDIYLPRATTAVDDDTAVESEGPPTRVGGTGSILLAEDEAMVREVTAASLTRLGYEVLTAESAEAAITVAERDPQRIDLLLTDMVMPGMSGPQLAARIHEICGELPVLLMSGYAHDSRQVGRDDPWTGPFIQKPFTLDRLAATLRQLLSSARRAR